MRYLSQARTITVSDFLIKYNPNFTFWFQIEVEEAPLEEEDEVFYIFYEDKKPEASYEAPTYQSPPTQVNTPHSVQALRLTLILTSYTS